MRGWSFPRDRSGRSGFIDRDLDLPGTKITDAGLVPLKRLQNLEYVELWDTRVTDVGVADLQKSIPDATITRRIYGN